MKRKSIILFGILLIAIKAAAQPSEIVYEGTLIATGFRQSIPLTSDGPFPIGFNFIFFGNTYSQFYTSANGLVMFTDPDGLYNTSVTIPNAATPNNYIAPFWDNLSIVDGGNVLYRTVGAAPNRKCIIQYKNMGFDPVPTPLGTFIVILYETTNVIQIEYRMIVDPISSKSHGGNATIGLENQGGTGGVLYAFHTGDAVYKEDAISFTPSGGTYTVNPDAIYDGVFLTTNTTLPDPGIVDLIMPAEDATVGADQKFEWGASTNATSYSLVIDVSPDFSTAQYYDAGSGLSYDVSGLVLDQTYYWAVFAYNSTALTWCEASRFFTSSSPPLTAVPREIWLSEGVEREIKLQYTGGDASAKTAIITSLPSKGQLWQVSGGVKTSQITSVPANVTDAQFGVIYVSSGGTGNNVGNFNFKFQDDTHVSPEAVITINVSAAGIPNLLYAARDLNIELQFDRAMNDPSGKQNQFAVKVDDTPVTITSAALKEGDPYSIILTLAVPLTGTETVLVSYTSGTISATTGGLLASFIDQSVTLIAQTITFTTNLLKKYGDSPFGLSSTSSSGLTAFTYSSSNLAVATISGSVLTILTPGTSDITARQAGDAVYAPARYIKTLNVSKADQTITFNSLPAKIVGDADFSPGATASSGLTVSYTSSNTAVATIVSGMIHIVGAGLSTITASQGGNTYYNAASPVNQVLTVSNPASKTLSLTSVFIQGLYNGGGVMNQAYDESGTPHWPSGVADHITVELHNSLNYSVVYSSDDVALSTTGLATVTIPSAYNGTYYITVRHRNSLQTVSSTPKSFEGSNISHSFGTPADVYGGNLSRMSDLSYAIYSGDVNQDDIIDLGDSSPVDNKSALAISGYIPEDINGDGLVDLSDAAIIDNNAAMAIGSVIP